MHPSYWWPASQGGNRYFSLPDFYCSRSSWVPVAFGITLAHTPECKYPICSPNNASFFPPLLCSLIHFPGILCSTKHSCEPAGLLSSLRACWEQPASAGKLLQSDVILGRSYATILMPDIVLARVVCYNVYGSLIFSPPQRMWNLIHACLSGSRFFCWRALKPLCLASVEALVLPLICSS